MKPRWPPWVPPVLVQHLSHLPKLRSVSAAVRAMGLGRRAPVVVLASATTASPSSSSVASPLSSTCPRLTIFSAPTAYNVTTYAHRRALLSWLRLHPVPRVVLLGSHPSLDALAAEFPDHVTVESDVDVNLEGAPLLNSVLARIQAEGLSSAQSPPPYHSASSSSSSSLHASSLCDMVMLVDPDVLLFNDMFFAARKVAARFPSFMILMGSWDVNSFRFQLDGLPPSIQRKHAAASASVGSISLGSDAASGQPVDEQKIRDFVRRRGRLNTGGGMGAFLWNRPADPLLPGNTTVPPFFLGRGAYERWLVHMASGAGANEGEADGALAGTGAESAGSGGSGGAGRKGRNQGASEIRMSSRTRQVVDASDSVTAVRVFSALDVQKEVEMVRERAMEEFPLPKKPRAQRAWWQRRGPAGDDAGAEEREKAEEEEGDEAEEERLRWHPLPRKSVKGWEVYANMHMARFLSPAPFSELLGTPAHAPWRLTPCFDPQGESMCLLRRRRPGNCTCEHAPLARHTSEDIRLHDGTWWFCGRLQALPPESFALNIHPAPSHSAIPTTTASLLTTASSATSSPITTSSSSSSASSSAASRAVSASPAPLTSSASASAHPSASTLRQRIATLLQLPASSSPLDAMAESALAGAAFWRGVEGMPHTLEQLLPRVADRHQTVVLLAAGSKDSTATLNFICMLRRLEITNFMLAALDPDMYSLAFLHGLPAAAAAEEAEGAGAVAAAVVAITVHVLRLGYSVLWSDVHAVWFANPLPHLLSLGPNVLAVQSAETNRNRAANGARSIGGGLMFAHADRPTLEALEAVAAYAAAVRAEAQADSAAGTEGGGESSARGRAEGVEVEEHRSAYDVLCGERGELKVGRDECRWGKHLRVLFLDRQHFPNGAVYSIWRSRNAAASCHRLRCMALHNGVIVGREAKAERMRRHGFIYYDEHTRMCLHPWHPRFHARDHAR
ncbi:unnamed protein product [Closterium sp. Yama58-4]|nr:unnamed protein product [Closterium sp. Yama58-4]